MAAALRLSDIVFYLLYKDSSLVNTLGGDGATALHFAHTTKIANIFLDCNADLDKRVGTTLLFRPRYRLTLPLMLRDFY